MHRAGRNHEDLQRQRHEWSHRRDEDREQSVALEPDPEFLPLTVRHFLAGKTPYAVAAVRKRIRLPSMEPAMAVVAAMYATLGVFTER